MIATRISTPHGRTRTLEAPAGFEGNVVPLSVAVIQDADRIPFSVTRWEPTPEEVEIIAAGGIVELWIMGLQPPVRVIALPRDAVAGEQ